MSEPRGAAINARSTIQIGLAVSFAAGIYFYADQNATQRTQLNSLMALKIDQRLARIEAKLGIATEPRQTADHQTSSERTATETLLRSRSGWPRRTAVFPE
jgi:hypothetical protein